MKKMFAISTNKEMYEITQALETEANLRADKDFGIVKIPAQYRKQSKFWILNEKLMNPLIRKILLKHNLWSKPW